MCVFIWGVILGLVQFVSISLFSQKLIMTKKRFKLQVLFLFLQDLSQYNLTTIFDLNVNLNYVSSP